MIVETSGIGQGDAAIVPLVDVPVYVMTPEYGAASQLEKIDMLDFAEFVAINKFDRKGAPMRCATSPSRCSATARAFKQLPDEMPVFGTMASRFNDDGVTALYQALKPRLAGTRPAAAGRPAAGGDRAPQHPPDIRWCRRRARRYLAEIADTVRGYKRARARAGAALAREIQQLRSQRRACSKDDKPRPRPAPPRRLGRWPVTREAHWTRTPCKLLGDVAGHAARPTPATNTW